MRYRFTDEDDALRAEARAYFQALMTADVKDVLRSRSEEAADLARKLIRQMGADGWLVLSWPKEYGGRAMTGLSQFVLFDEVRRSGVPFPFVTVNTVGPALMAFGTEAQKATYLPAIQRGEVVFAIGYTEPDSGTDLASLTTSAKLDGDQWRINGNKVYTSGADRADFVWLACRTGKLEARHRAISILIVPTNSDGFSHAPLHTVGGIDTTITHYDNICVPADNIVGEVDGGWGVITNQLNHERVGLAALTGGVEELFDDVVAWAAATPAADESVVIDQGWVRSDLAKCRALLDAVKVSNWKLAAASSGDLPADDAAAAKIFSTETMIEIYRLMSGVLGSQALVRPGEPGAVLEGRAEIGSRAVQINTFGGGVNDVLRDIVGIRGLSLAREQRRKTS